jgi:putative transposase
MGRPPRLQAHGATYHVTCRGNRRHDIFTDAHDRFRFLQLVEDNVWRLGWDYHCYCLMTNHYHLLVRTPEPDLSRGMHRLNGVYAKWFNRRHGYTGHLFERRFTSVVLEGDAHLLELTRYIVLNPVRAGLAVAAGDWKWSSYSATIGEAKQPAFLSTNWILSLFSRDSNRARELYAEFVAAGARLTRQRRSSPIPMPGTGTGPI